MSKDPSKKKEDTTGLGGSSDGTDSTYKYPGASRVAGFEAKPGANDDEENTTYEEHEVLPIASLVIDEERNRPSMISALSTRMLSFRLNFSDSDFTTTATTTGRTSTSSRFPWFERIPSEYVTISENNDDDDYDDYGDYGDNSSTMISGKKNRKKNLKRSPKSQRFWLSLILSLFLVSLVVLPVIVAILVLDAREFEETHHHNNENKNIDNGTIVDDPGGNDGDSGIEIKDDENEDDNGPENDNSSEKGEEGTEDPGQEGGGGVRSAPNNVLLNIVKQVSSEELLMDQTTPQYQAMHWMLDEDGDEASNINNEGNAAEKMLDEPTEVEIVERYIIAVLYFATGGPSSWVHSNDFLIRSKSVCKWGSDVMSIGTASGGQEEQERVASSIPSFARVLCTGGRVTSVLIENNGLRGTLPEELTFLKDLENLTLIRNHHLSGSIPLGVGNLAKLQALHLYENSLRGEIPSTIGLLKDELLHLDLARNRLTGSLPTGIGYLENLQELYLEYNRFEGSLPESMKDMNQLVALRLHGNAFTGDISSLYCPLPRDDMTLVADCGMVECSCCTTCCNLSDDPDDVQYSQNHECAM